MLYQQWPGGYNSVFVAQLVERCVSCIKIVGLLWTHISIKCMLNRFGYKRLPNTVNVILRKCSPKLPPKWFISISYISIFSASSCLVNDIDISRLETPFYSFPVWVSVIGVNNKPPVHTSIINAIRVDNIIFKHQFVIIFCWHSLHSPPSWDPHTRVREIFSLAGDTVHGSYSEKNHIMISNLRCYVIHRLLLRNANNGWIFNCFNEKRWCIISFLTICNYYSLWKTIKMLLISPEWKCCRNPPVFHDSRITPRQFWYLLVKMKIWINNQVSVRLHFHVTLCFSAWVDQTCLWNGCRLFCPALLCFNEGHGLKTSIIL